MDAASRPLPPPVSENPKSEARNPKRIQTTKSEASPKHEIRNKIQASNPKSGGIRGFKHWGFGFGICLGFRISSFGFVPESIAQFQLMRLQQFQKNPAVLDQVVADLA